MIVLESLEAVRNLCERYVSAGLSVGFVPTMGALHAGHVSLFRQSRCECEKTVVSIFVNPTQFGPGEDFASYPRPREADTELCRGAGVDLLFFASAGEVYPEGFQTWVTVGEVSKPLCGKSRPVHFRGVATVVTQLLSIVTPHRAYFGEKDYQQCLVVQRLAQDLHLGCSIRICPTLREPDGLAMSSRNQYLDPRSRRSAPRIRQALLAARDLVLAGETQVERILDRLRSVLEPGEDLRIDYAEVRDASTLEDFGDGVIRRGGAGIVIAVAVIAGRARLIDNIVVQP